MTPTPPRATRRVALAALCLLAAALGGVSPSAAAPSTTGPVARVSVLTPTWTSVHGDVSAKARVRLRREVSRLDVRLRLFDENGSLLWQRTSVQRPGDALTRVVSFARPASELGLEPGVYSVHVQVRADGSAAPADATATLLVADPGAPRLPVSVVIRVAGPPQRSPSGVLVADPLTDGARTEAESLARFALLRPDLALSASIPPILLEEWADAGDGFELIGTDGTITVSADATASVACRETIDALGRASGSGLTLLAGMYAEPDPEGIARCGDPAQVAAGQLALGARVASDTLRSASQTASVEPTGIVVPGGVLASDVATALARAGIRFLVIDPSALVLPGGHAGSPGVYTLPSSSATGTARLTALALDRTTARLMLETNGAAAARGRLLKRALTRTRVPIVMEFTVGGGSTLSEIQPALAMLQGLPWVRLVDAPTAAGTRGAAASLPIEARVLPPAPAGYWDAVSDASARSRALLAAAGASDPDAQLGILEATIAASRLWAGPDGSWPLADRGLEYAHAASRIASATLSAVQVDIPTVTLSGSAGQVPVSIRNGSAKTLSVVVAAHSSKSRLTKARFATVLLPGENIVSVPVDLGKSLSAPLTITVRAGGLPIAESTAMVRGSYLDRIVVLGGVVLVLLVLLWYVRAKARPALARRRGRADDNDGEAAEKPERHV